MGKDPDSTPAVNLVAQLLLIHKRPVLEVRPLGLKGAAFAALGDNPRLFTVDPFTARVETEAGVKLGESTFRRFLILYDSRDIVSNVLILA